MVDRSVLEQVLAYLDGELVDLPVEDTDVVLLAVLRAVDEAPEVEVCVEHGALDDWWEFEDRYEERAGYCAVAVGGEWDLTEHCRMVVVYLVPKEQT